MAWNREQEAARRRRQAQRRAGIVVTKTGRELTEADIEALSAEAEQGYEPDRLIPRERSIAIHPSGGHSEDILIPAKLSDGMVILETGRPEAILEVMRATGYGSQRPLLPDLRRLLIPEPSRGGSRWLYCQYAENVPTRSGHGHLVPACDYRTRRMSRYRRHYRRYHLGEATRFAEGGVVTGRSVLPGPVELTPTESLLAKARDGLKWRGHGKH